MARTAVCPWSASRVVRGALRWLGPALLGAVAGAWLVPRTGRPEIVLPVTVVLALLTCQLNRRLAPTGGGRLWASAVLVGLAVVTSAHAATPVGQGGIPPVPEMPLLLLVVAAGVAGTCLWRGRRATRVAAGGLVTATVLAGGWVLVGHHLDYHTEQVAWRHGEVTLAGTLYRPNGDGPHPLVILIGGAGPYTRTYAQGWADVLARNELATLTYDKRGSGASQGGSPHDSFPELASDITAAIDHLAARPDIDGTRVGVWGHSEGGWVATQAAATGGRVGFLVLVSGGGVSVQRNIENERTPALARAGLTGVEIEQAWALRAAVNDYYRTGAGRAELEQRIRAAMATAWWETARELVPLPTPGEVVASGSPEAERWIAYWDYSAVPLLERLEIPFLSVHGGQDPIDPAYEAAAALESVVATTGVAASRVLLYPRAGHAIQVSPFGVGWLPPYYPRGYVDEVVAWMTEQATGGG
jgi:pimeloyl-ACP methyl ester carboxylesterase